MIGHSCAHQTNFFSAFGAFSNICQNVFQSARTRLSKAVACHTETTMTATATSNLYNIHILELCATCHNGRSMKISINILHPLTSNFGRHTFIVLHSYKLVFFIIYRSVIFRHINTGKLRQIQQLFFLISIGVNSVQNLLYGFFTFANNESICHRSQRLRIKGSARATNNNQRFFFVAHFSTKLNVTQLQHGQQIIVVHFKGQHYKNNAKVRKLTLCFYTQKSCLSLLVLFNQTAFRQKEAFTSAVTTGVNHLVKNVHTKVTHAKVVHIGVNEGYGMVQARLKNLYAPFISNFLF